MPAGALSLSPHTSFINCKRSHVSFLDWIILGTVETSKKFIYYLMKQDTSPSVSRTAWGWSRAESEDYFISENSDNGRSLIFVMIDTQL